MLGELIGRAEDLLESGTQFPLAALFEMSVVSTFFVTRQARSRLDVSITVIPRS